MLDRLTRPRVLGLGRLEEVKDVLRARCRPESEEMVIRISEGPTAADGNEARVPDLREDHDWRSTLIASAQHPGPSRRDGAHDIGVGVRGMARGVKPRNDPWEFGSGHLIASFADPAGQIWELVAGATQPARS